MVPTKTKKSNSLLQTKLIKSLEALIQDPADFEKRFSNLLKYRGSKSDMRIPENKHKLIFSHIVNTIKTSISMLKQKDILEDDYKKVYSLIFTLIEAHPWVSAFPDRNSELRDLANHCLQQLVLAEQIKLRMGREP